MKKEFYDDFHRQSLIVKAVTIVGLALVLVYLYW